MSDEDIKALKHKKGDGEFITKSDQLIKQLIDNPERPFVLATTVYDPEDYGVPLTLVGKVFIISDDGSEFFKGKYVDRKATEQLLYQDFAYDKISSVPFDSLCFMNRVLATNYATAFWTLFVCSEKEKDYPAALKHLHYAKKFARTEIVWYFLDSEFKLYAKMGQGEKADSVAQELLSLPNLNIEIRKGIAITYYDLLSQKEKHSIFMITNPRE